MGGLSRSSKTSHRNSGKPYPLETSHTVLPCKMQSVAQHCVSLHAGRLPGGMKQLWDTLDVSPSSSCFSWSRLLTLCFCRGYLRVHPALWKSWWILLGANSASWLTEGPEAVREDRPLKPRATSPLRSDSGFCFTFIGFCVCRCLKSTQRGSARKEWAPESAEFIPELDKCLVFDW